MRYGLAGLLLFGLVGCEGDRRLVVEASGAWEGWLSDAVDGSAWIQAEGDMSFPLGSGRTCWAFDAIPPDTLAVFIRTSSLTGPDRQPLDAADCVQ